jgi:hypothetical protein
VKNNNLNRLIQPFESLGKIILDLNYSAFCMVFLVLFSIKTGLRGILPWGDFSPVENFPLPTQTFSSNSHGLLALTKAMGIYSKNSYFALSVLLLMIFLIVFFSLLKHKFDGNKSKILVLVYLGSPVHTVLMGNIGRHDILSILGILGFLLSKKLHNQILFLALACLGSPEHVLAAFIIYALGALILGKKHEFKCGIVAVSFSLGYTILSTLWVNSQVSAQSRFQNILTMHEYIVMGLRNFANNFLLEWYSYFGMYWFFVVLGLFLLDKQKKLMMTSLLLFTMLFNIVMVDKTRDFVVAILPFSILLLQSVFNTLYCSYQSLSSSDRRIFLGIFAFFSFLFPAIEITFEGQPRAPYFWLITKIVESIS